MRRTYHFVSWVIMGLVFIAGCGDVKGVWVLREYQPYLDEGAFRICKVKFHPNNSFEALAYKGDKLIKSKGMYDYCPCTEELMLMTGDKVLSYKAHRVSKKELRITTCGPDSVTTTAVMARYYQCPYCACCATCKPPCECK